MQAIKATQPSCCVRRDLDDRRWCIPRAAVFAGAAESAVREIDGFTEHAVVRHPTRACRRDGRILRSRADLERSEGCALQLAERDVASMPIWELMRAERLGSSAITTVKKSDIDARNAGLGALTRPTAVLLCSSAYGHAAGAPTRPLPSNMHSTHLPCTTTPHEHIGNVHPRALLDAWAALWLARAPASSSARRAFFDVAPELERLGVIGCGSVNNYSPCP